MDYEIPLEIIFTKSYYSGSELFQYVGHSIDIVSFNNGCFILIRNTNLTFQARDFNHLEFLILYQQYYNFLNRNDNGYNRIVTLKQLL